MRKGVTYESVEDRVWTLAGASAEQHRELAEEFLELSRSWQPDDEVTRAELMVEAGQQLALVGDHESALTAYRGAVETGEEV
ncbi:MAG: hypothetical protein ACLGIA_08105, partial [Actinomycetes bacterium]